MSTLGSDQPVDLADQPRADPSVVVHAVGDCGRDEDYRREREERVVRQRGAEARNVVVPGLCDGFQEDPEQGHPRSIA